MMTLGQALPWIAGARLVGDPGTAIARVHSDTRSLLPGDLFVAIHGERFDGNRFLAQARAAGASAALAHGGLVEAGLPGIEVADTRLALGQLALGWRSQFQLPLIGVAGSNGKTTVTQMLAAILEAARPGRCLATQGNLNNDIGAPLTLLRLRAQHELAVLELGMNHPGEIAYLARLTRCTVALVNNAQREHLEFMDSVLAVAMENGALLEALAPDGVAVLPAFDPHLALWRRMAAGRRVLTFGLAEDASGSATGNVETIDLCVTACLWSNGAWRVLARSPQGELSYSLHIAGRHNVLNSAAAAVCALAAGITPEAITTGLARFRPVPGRSHVLSLQLGGQALTLVDDSYNANPDSARAAIDVLAAMPGPRLLVLGDMGEVGSQGPAMHLEVGAYARERSIDALVCLGELSKHSAQAFGAGAFFSDIEALLRDLRQRLPGVASVLVKGSRFMKMERVAQAIRAFAKEPPCS
jgi:UDP-N-acetylmuramoyl-tripeptide--D-alanyl-D-alanine ligase